MNETVTYAIFGNNSNITAAIIGVFGAILGALIALLGTWVNARIIKKSELERRRSEEKRWYADHYLDRKINSIINFQSSLTDWYFSIHFYGNYPPSTLKEFNDQVNPKSDAYLRSLANVSIYLDQAEYSKLTEALGAFRQANTAIWLSLPADQCPAIKESYPTEVTVLDWEKLEEAFFSAGTLIKQHLNPEILKQVPLEPK